MTIPDPAVEAAARKLAALNGLDPDQPKPGYHLTWPSWKLFEKEAREAILAALPHLGEPVEWRPVATAPLPDIDRSAFGRNTLTTDTLWVRDEKGRIFEAWKCVVDGRSFWWDLDDENECNPVDWLPLVQPAPAVKVKPLEWLDDGDGGLVAHSTIGDYELHKVGYSDVEEWELTNPVERIGRFDLDKLDTAIAAAQADYEARILSALGAGPEPLALAADHVKAHIVPADVAELVISAREVAYSDIQDAVRAFCPDMMEYMDALDKATEAFADRVPWEDDPEEEVALAAQEVGDA